MGKSASFTAVGGGVGWAFATLRMPDCKPELSQSNREINVWYADGNIWVKQTKIWPLPNAPLFCFDDCGRGVLGGFSRCPVAWAWGRGINEGRMKVKGSVWSSGYSQEKSTEEIGRYEWVALKEWTLIGSKGKCWIALFPSPFTFCTFCWC